MNRILNSPAVLEVELAESDPRVYVDNYHRAAIDIADLRFFDTEPRRSCSSQFTLCEVLLHIIVEWGFLIAHAEWVAAGRIGSSGGASYEEAHSAAFAEQGVYRGLRNQAGWPWHEEHERVGDIRRVKFPYSNGASTTLNLRRNPDTGFFDITGVSCSECFIATAVLGHQFEERAAILLMLRRHLQRTAWGPGLRRAEGLYYAVSSRIVPFLRRSRLLRVGVRTLVVVPAIVAVQFGLRAWPRLHAHLEMQVAKSRFSAVSWRRPPVVVDSGGPSPDAADGEEELELIGDVIAREDHLAGWTSFSPGYSRVTYSIRETKRGAYPLAEIDVVHYPAKSGEDALPRLGQRCHVTVDRLDSR